MDTGPDSGRPPRWGYLPLIDKTPRRRAVSLAALYALIAALAVAAALVR